MARRFAPSGSDLLVAAVLVAIAGLELWLSSDIEPKWAAVPLELAAGVAVAWRRRLPLATMSVVSAAWTLESMAGVPIQVPLVPNLAIIVAVYSLVAHSSLERVFAGLAVVAVGLAAGVTSQREGLDNFAFGAIFVCATCLVGWLVRVRIEEAARLERRAERLERERAEQTRLAAEAERRRIARELHDVIAHSVSVMVVQAGAAEQMLRSDPARALAPVRSVQETGRKALAEMGRLLGSCVSTATRSGSRRPNPVSTSWLSSSPTFALPGSLSSCTWRGSVGRSRSASSSPRIASCRKR